jgi:hypothetical protein
MDSLTLLQRARDAGLRVEAADTLLKISGPRKAEPLVRLLAEHKAQVLDALRKVQEVQKGVEHDPGPYASALAALRAQCPAYVDAADWQRAIEDGRRFITQWGERAEALGWTSDDLLGLHSPPEKPAPNYRRLSRYDQLGLVWCLQSRPVVELTTTAATLRCPNGAHVTYRRRTEPALAETANGAPATGSGNVVQPIGNVMQPTPPLVQGAAELAKRAAA